MAASVGILTDILDRLSGISAVRDRVTELAAQQVETRRIILEQQKDIAELRGQLKALIQIQSSNKK